MIFFQIYLFILGSACAVGWFRWIRLDPSLHWIVALVNFTFFIEGSAYYLIYFQKQSPLFLYHFASPVYVGIWLIYFVRRGFKVQWAAGIGVIFVIFHAITSYLATFEVTNSASNAFRAIMMTMLGI